MLSPLLDDVQPAPSGRDARLAWLAARGDEIASLCRAAMRRIIANALTSWERTLTADAGDLAALGSIPAEWEAFMENDLASALSQVHLTAVVSAVEQMPTVMSAAALDQWTGVVNEAAVSYMAGATNRLAAVGQQVWRDVRSQTVTAIEKGLSTEALKSRLEGITNWSEYRADTVARTETVGAFVQGELAAQRALGDDGPVEKVWVAALDDRTRETHADAHDQCVPISEPFNVGGVSMDAPHDPGAPAGEVVNCRCVVEFLYPGDTRPDGSTIEGEIGGGGGDDDLLPDPVPEQGLDPQRHSMANHLREDGTFTPERQALHDQIIADTLGGHAPQPDPEMLFMGGGGGAGKSTVLNESGLLRKPTDTVMVNADDFKLMLPEAKQMMANGDSMWAGFVHEESSYLAKRARIEALRGGLNVTMDAVGSNAARVAEQVAQAKALGYHTRAAYISIEPSSGVARAIKRFDDAVARGEPGRWIDPDVVRAAHVDANAAWQQVVNSVDEALLIDNETSPFTIARAVAGNVTVADPDAWAQYLTRTRVTL